MAHTILRMEAVNKIIQEKRETIARLAAARLAAQSTVEKLDAQIFKAEEVISEMGKLANDMRITYEAVGAAEKTWKDVMGS